MHQNSQSPCQILYLVDFVLNCVALISALQVFDTPKTRWAVIKFWKTCSLFLDTHSKLVTFWVNFNDKRQFHQAKIKQSHHNRSDGLRPFLLQLQKISQSDWLIWWVHITLLASMCRAIPFSARTLKKNNFFDVDIVVKNKSECGLTWSVLLSTTSTHQTFLENTFANSFNMQKQSRWNQNPSLGKVMKFSCFFNRFFMVLIQRVMMRALSSLSFQLSTNVCKDFFRYLWYNCANLVPEAIYKERGAIERGRGAKRGGGKIASVRIRWKSHFHTKAKYRNWTSTMIGLHTRYQDRNQSSSRFNFCTWA